MATSMAEPTHDTPNDFDVEKILLQLKRWQEKLLDMSKANPLLGLNRARAAKLKIVAPELADIFEEIVLKESELHLPFIKKMKSKKAEDALIDIDAKIEEEKERYQIEEGDITFEFSTPADLRRKLRRIYDNSRTTVEERGVVTLYLTFGVIQWNDGLLGESVSPILLVPCELISKGPNTALRLRMTDDEIQLNPAVVYYFREKHKLDLPELTQDLDQTSLISFLKKIEEAIGEHRWEVANEIWLGTFSFESLVLYQDLKSLANIACSNPLIAALAHASRGHGEESEALGEDLDSLPTPDIVPLPVLPADSSQLKALTYANGKKSLVIHGPPGTGKSQTISNIIADALGKNKKVLFVSAKMAALNVVFDRLKKEGLGEFCLEAHGTKAGKLKIIEELKRTVESDGVGRIGSLEQELESLRHIRQQLNDYVTALHEPISPLGLSVFQAIGRFAKLQKGPDIKASLPWENVLDASMQDVNGCIDVLAEITHMAGIFDVRNTHPLRGFSGLEYSLQIQEQLESDLRFLSQSFTDLVNLLEQLKQLFPEQSFSFEDLAALIPALDAVSKIKKLPHDWWTLDEAKIIEKKKILEEALVMAKEFNEKRIRYQVFSGLPHKETVELLKEIETTFNPWVKRLTVSYFKWKGGVRQKLKSNIKLGHKNIREYHFNAKRLSELEDWFVRCAPTLSEELPAQQFTDLQAIGEAVAQCDTAILLFRSLPTYDWRQSMIAPLDPQISNASAAIVSTFNQRTALIHTTAQKIDKWWAGGFMNNLSALQIPLRDFSLRAKEILAGIGQLREWVLLQKEIQRCEDLNLGTFLRSVGDADAASLPLIFEKRFLSFWIDAAINSRKGLADFSGTKQEELIEKFRVLDERMRRLANFHIKASAALASKKVKSAQSGLGNGSEIGILRFEMQKRKKIKPLRRLFSEIPHVLQALKPCMLMSPVSVSTFLKPGSFHFDLVIFDEASQLPTPEAIPSILRAEQVIVAGDPNQLPPTSFFDASFTGESEEEAEEEQFRSSLESLLDDCVAVVPVFQEAYLKWHYRSHDERLINFSNHYFYENRLMTFPSTRTDNDGIGVCLEYLPDGVWDRGKSRTNRREARRAAQLAIEHFTKFPERSLGIVALNSYQREAIEDAISEELIARPELLPFFDPSRQDGFFVKSLESVQGDERDVIIISVGYAKNADGVLALNFGPLNMDGGWRRLNVLVTRARWQIILLTSLRSSELHGVNPNNRGALALKNFIAYAERGGSLPPDLARATEGETDDFEDEVRAVLMERGFVVDAQVGVSSFRIDLAIRDPRDQTRYLIGIECDGATYHSSRVARDRDLLREKILRDMGWKLHRVWSTEWFHNRDAAITLMLHGIERVMSQDLSESVPAAIVSVDEEFTFETLPAAKVLKEYKPGVPYEKYKKRFKREILMLPKNIYWLKDAIFNVVEVEGPMHKELLQERLKDVFGVEKIGANIDSNIDQALKSLVRSGPLESKKGFIWSETRETSRFRVPGDGVKRPLRYISPQELSLAILYLVEDQFGMMRDQIPKSITKLFEISRTDPDEADRLRDVIDDLIETQRLVGNGNQIYLP